MELLLWLMGESSSLLLPFCSSLFFSFEKHVADFRYLRTFLNKVFKFLGIGIALYAIVKAYIYCSHDEGIIKHEKKCQYCRKKISMKACLFLAPTFVKMSDHT